MGRMDQAIFCRSKKYSDLLALPFNLASQGWFQLWAVTFIFQFASLVGPSEGLANVGEAFGFGAKIQSLAGAGVCLGEEAFAAYHNPAGLISTQPGRIHFDWGILYAEPHFSPIREVLIQNQYTADANVIGDVDTSYPSTLGQQLGFSYPLLPRWHQLTLGVTAFLPLEQIARIDTGDAHIPEYVLYRSRTQRPQVDLGIGVAISPELSLGLGLHTTYSLTSHGSLFLNTSSQRTSSVRFVASLKPKIAPTLGILYRPESLTVGNLGKWTALAAVIRLPVASKNTAIVHSAARLFGDFAAVDLQGTASSTLYYDPLSIEGGGIFHYLPTARVYFQFEYQAWSHFQPPALALQQASTLQCDTASGSDCSQTIQIAPGIVPTLPYRNIFVPRIAHELDWGQNKTLRVGYAYRPSFLGKLSQNNGNYLDPSKHIWNLGLGWAFERMFSLGIPVRVDFNLCYQHLLTQDIQKTPGNEIGESTNEKIGSPGYSAGGNLYGGGISLSMVF